MAEDNFQSAADEASIEEPVSYDGCATLKNCFVSVLKDIFCHHRHQQSIANVNKVQSLRLSWVWQQQDSLSLIAVT